MIPKIISRIVAAILIAVILYALLPSVWFWIGFEVIAALLVATGCGGEWYLHHHPAGRKKVEKEEHHKLESRFIAAVVIGVFMEFFSLAHAIPETVKLEKDVASANEAASQANALAAQSELKLKQLTTDRTITDQQQNEIVAFLKGEPHLPIAVLTTADFGETFRLAMRVVEVLNASGYTNHSQLPIGFSGVTVNDISINPTLSANVSKQTDIEVWMNLWDFSNPSSVAGNVGFKLFQAFQLASSISVQHAATVNVPAGEVFIFVTEKQNPK
jgi:hypothetical protein